MLESFLSRKHFRSACVQEAAKRSILCIEVIHFHPSGWHLTTHASVTHGLKVWCAATLSAPYEPSPLIPAHDQACLITPKSPMLRTSTARPDADSPLPLAEAAPVTGNTPVHSHTQSQEGSRAASFASKLAMFNAGAAMPGVPQRTLNSSSKPRKKK